MKNGIDLLLILVLLITIAFLVFSGFGGKSPVELPSILYTSTSTEAATSTRTSAPTSIQTPTLIPASVTIPTKTVTYTPFATETATKAPTPTFTSTATSIITPVSSLDQEIKTGIERGNRIIQAIEAYHTSKAAYPPTLNALSPAFLSNIPITSTGQAFFYRLFNGSSPLAGDVYWLSFRAINQDHVACTYFRRLDYWDCDYSSP